MYTVGRVKKYLKCFQIANAKHLFNIVTCPSIFFSKISLVTCKIITIDKNRHQVNKLHISSKDSTDSTNRLEKNAQNCLELQKSGFINVQFYKFFKLIVTNRS